MSPFFLLLFTVAPQRPLISEAPAWIAGVLRDAPPSRPSFYSPAADGSVAGSPRPEVDVTRLSAVANPSPSAWDVMQRRAFTLIARGEYEAAYQAEAEGHEVHELLGVDFFADAALLTGRAGEAQELLVQKVRLHPGSRRYDLLLSLATAMQGHAYPGQGAWALEELRQRLDEEPDEARLVAHYQVPATPTALMGLSVLALGVSRDEPAYLEWALRLAPRCELAGSRLVTLYGYRHRDADIVRVTGAMVKALPSGATRDRFATSLRDAQKRIEAQTGTDIPKHPHSSLLHSRLKTWPGRVS